MSQYRGDCKTRVRRRSAARFFRLRCLIQSLQEIFSRQDAKSAKKKYFPASPNLACFASLRESSLFRFCKPIFNREFQICLARFSPAGNKKSQRFILDTGNWPLNLGEYMPAMGRQVHRGLLPDGQFRVSGKLCK